MGEPIAERWLPVPGWEQFYEVSDQGRVRSLPRKGGNNRLYGGKIRKLYIYPGNGGYPVVTLSGGGHKSGPVLVHRLLMEAFIGPCPEGEEARHLDGDPANCVLTNLLYGTHAENMQDMLRHGTHYWASKTHCPKSHEYAPENTYVHRDGRRECKRCWRLEIKPPHYQTLKTHCPQGHEYTPENTATHNGKRSCRTCARERARARKAQAKAA